jgi:PPOX class probable F420-dependent enzyme
VYEAAAQRRFATARVATLGTIGAADRPHLVPVTFVVEGAMLWSAVDAKPKRSVHLRRHANIAAHPLVSLLAHGWEEDWSALWWVRVDGVARVSDEPATVERAIRLLHRKYPQYNDIGVGGPVIEVVINTWRGWHA